MGIFKIIGHRGYGPTHFLGRDHAYNIDFPENSIAAFKRALDFGADGIELDVQVSRDREAVVFHDRKLRDFARFSGDPSLAGLQVNQLSYDELERLDVGGGHKIPTVAEVLNMTLDYRRPLFINLDIKSIDAVKPVLAALKDTATAGHMVVVSSYDWDILRAFRKLSPAINLVSAVKTELLFGADQFSMPDYVPLSDTYDSKIRQRIGELKTDVGVCAIDCTFSDFRPELIDIAKEFGLGIQISTATKRVTALETNRSIVAQLRTASETIPEIPFVVCKVDEPDVLIKTSHQHATTVRRVAAAANLSPAR